jgi:hypothetical protein
MMQAWVRLHYELETDEQPGLYAIFRSATNHASMHSSNIMNSIYMNATRVGEQDAVSKTSAAAMSSPCVKPSDRMWASAQQYLQRMEMLAIIKQRYDDNDEFEDHEDVDEAQREGEDFIGFQRYGVPIYRVQIGDWQVDQRYPGQLLCGINMVDQQLELKMLKWYPDTGVFKARQRLPPASPHHRITARITAL